MTFDFIENHRLKLLYSTLIAEDTKLTYANSYSKTFLHFIR